MLCFKKQCKKHLRSAPKTAVVVAFFRELQPFLDIATVIDECNVRCRKYYVLEYEGKEFLLFMSGTGLRKARWSARVALSIFNINTLIFSGIAANVKSGNEVGDTLVAKEWVKIGTNNSVSVDKQLLEQVAHMDGIKVVETGATSNFFITDTSTLPQNISSIDMETYEIAKVAHKKEVPFIAFRTISDHADGKETGENFDIAAKISAQKVLDFISSQ